MKFVAAIFKPILTILVTVLAGALIVSVAWPGGDDFIQQHVPVWERLDPAIAQVREWLGIHQSEETDPWWRSWD
ncbi:MAG: hypothetical protein RIA71_06035 [Oceanicaulis sp.]